MNKKNNLIVIIVIIVLVVLLAVILKLKTQKQQPVPLTETEMGLNQAIVSDSTKTINDNINSINVDDTIGTDELNAVDQELEKL
ncbi:MAG: hypothetical protein WC603_03000 [Candidatus Paceibacterota bacterium]|jgi:hypothetical protein